MVNPSKTNIMIFTRKYKPEPIEPFKLWGKVIPFTTSVKYLGLFIDTKLSWKIHLAESREKFYSCMWMCRRAMSKSWGIKASIALWLYRAVLLPRLLYASVIWWPRARKVEAKNLLKSLQGSYLRAAVGAMKTTPTEALEIALCIPPLDLAVEHAARNTAYRLKCQGEWRNTGLGHTRLDLLQKNLFTLKQDRILRKYQLVKRFTIPTRKEWTDPKRVRDPNVDLWFTDGSGINNCFGAGFYGPKDDHRESIPVGSHSTVFTAEILAILRCTEHLLSNNTKGRKINICSDSRAAILALAKTTTKSALVWDCMLALERLSGLNKVTLVWVPGHQGIPGNEIADSLAKKGANEAPSDQVAGIPFAVGKEIIKSCLKREHLSRWEKLETCRQAKTLMENSRPGRAKELLELTKQKLRMAVGLLTGHSALLRAHLFNLGLAEQKECRLCGDEKEDNVHILCHCPALVCKRYKTWGQANYDYTRHLFHRLFSSCQRLEEVNLVDHHDDINELTLCKDVKQVYLWQLTSSAIFEQHPKLRAIHVMHDHNSDFFAQMKEKYPHVSIWSLISGECLV
ncbi:uncharacterized protein [Temnothorax nylanderi]|uniref:uncharacterized protein n=1 Tax=Temnothorax nylanderi TaxID=102681 RepID=UPI003A8B230A